MTTRFAIGQSVSVAFSKRYPKPNGPYRILATMPRSGGGTQYRIKSELEKFERIIDEMYLDNEQV